MKQLTFPTLVALAAFAIGLTLATFWFARQDLPATLTNTEATSTTFDVSPIQADTDSKSAPLPNIVQQATIHVDGIGDVVVQAVEPTNGFPYLALKDVKTGAVITRIETRTYDANEPRPSLEYVLINPFLRFKILSIRELPHPLIVAIQVNPGGSGNAFEATLISAVRGKFRKLNQEPLRFDNIGSIHIGDLGKNKGFGVAV